MRTILAILLLASPIFAADPKIQRDVAYAQPKNQRQMLDVYAPAEGKKHPVIVWIHDHAMEFGGDPDTIFVMGHGTINSDLGLPDDKPTKAVFDFLDDMLKKQNGSNAK